VAALEVERVGYLRRKCFELHYPAQTWRTSRCGRSPCPTPPG